MKIIKLICEHCHQEFEKSDQYIKSELKKNSNHKFFCSKTCVYQNRVHLKKVKVTCTFCKKECITDENDLKRNKNYYCSWECYESKRNLGKTLVNLVCPICQQTFTQTLRNINGRKRKGYKQIFCSAKCSSESQRNDYSKEFSVKCDHCSKDIIKTGRQLKLRKLHFCNPRCKGSYFAKLYAFGEKRSKLEEKVEYFLKQTYPTLEFSINNREILKGLELDFYFPTLNFAIEINGPAHFTPIYGDDALLRTQRNDIIKKHLCKKKNIRLLEVTNTLTYNVDNSQEIFITYIKPIIDELLYISQENHQPLLQTSMDLINT